MISPIASNRIPDIIYPSKREMDMTLEMLERRALVAERKADEWSCSDKPWALRNLRIYQNLASKFWGEYYAALRIEEGR